MILFVRKTGNPSKLRMFCRPLILSGVNSKCRQANEILSININNNNNNDNITLY